MTSASQGAESYGHRMIEDALDRARVPFWTKAACVRSAEELNSALAKGGVDLVHFTDARAAGFAALARDYTAVASVFLDDSPLSARERDDVDTLDLALLEDESLAAELTCATSTIGSCLDVDSFDPNVTPIPREHLASIDDDSRMLLALATETDVEAILAELDSEVASDCNILAMCGPEGSALLDRPIRIIALLQHAEAMLLGAGDEYHQQISLHAAAAGCPAIDCTTEDPRDWADQIAALHSEWRTAGKVPRHPDEDAIAKAGKTNGLRAYGAALAEAYASLLVT